MPRRPQNSVDKDDFEVLILLPVPLYSLSVLDLTLPISLHFPGMTTWARGKHGFC